MYFYLTIQSTMKQSRLFFTFYFFIVLANLLTAQTWQWATIESGANATGYAIAKDNAGSVFLAGNRMGIATFGSSTYAAGNGNKFVLKYSSSGALLWSYVFNAPSSTGIDIDVDNAGDVYVTCTMSGSCVIGSYTLVTNGAFSTGILLLKLNSAGTLLWAKNISNPSTYITSNSIASDGSGNTTVCGFYSGPSINFSTTTLNNPNPSLACAFVVKFDPNGTAMWADHLISPSSPKALSVAVDASSNSYVTGQFGFQISAGTSTLIGTNSMDLFIAKYTPNGALVWLKTTGGALGTEVANGIKPDPFGNIYITGVIYGSACVIGSDTYASANNSQDAFIAKLDSNGVFLWSRSLGSTGNEIGHNVAANATGVFVTSSVENHSATVVGTQTYTFSNSSDGMLIAQYTASGNLVTVLPLNGGGNNASDLCLHNCALYLGGDLYTPSVAFGNIILTHTAPESPFVARLQLAVGEPTISISGTFTMCSGGSATLQATGANSYVWSTGAASSSIVVSPATSSVYVVTGSSSNLACASTTAQTVVVMTLPNFSVVSSPSIICAGASVTLSASGANTYSWSNGATGASQIVTALAPTNYSVIGTDASNGCTATTTLQLNISQCSGIENVINETHRFLVFPNPSANDVNIYSTHECNVMLTTILGEKIITLHINANETRRLSLSVYGAGVYYLQCLQTNEVRKIVSEGLQ